MRTKSDNLKIIGFSAPASYARRVEAIARRERRTKRAVFESMVDLYEEVGKRREALLDDLVSSAIGGVKSEERSSRSKRELEETKKTAKTFSKRMDDLGWVLDREGLPVRKG